MVDDADLRSAVSAELQRGEKVLWVGKPTPMRVVMQRGGDVIGAVAGFVVVVLLLITFPIYLRVNLDSTDIFIRVLVFVVVLAFLFSLARPVYEYINAQGTVYAVTNRRALRIKPTLTRGRIVQSYTHIQHIERQERADGSGDLIFGSINQTTNYARYGLRVRRQPIGFFGIPDVRRVEALMLSSENSTSPPNPLV